jgi:hypothetical protein
MRGEDSGSQLRNALGALKDTIGAVGNLDELLRSPRVAPKAVSAVLPDMAATLPALRAELEATQALLAGRFDPRSVEQVCAFILDDVAALTQALAEATPNQRALTASTRLALERKVDKLQQRLLGALPLCELLVELWREPSLPIDVHELLVLLRQGDQSHGLRGEALQVTLRASEVPVWLRCSPRAALTMIAVGAGLLRDEQPSGGLRIEVGTQAGVGRTALTLLPHPPDVPLFKLVVPPVVAPTRSCLEAAATAIGVRVELEPRRLVLAWSAAAPP